MITLIIEAELLILAVACFWWAARGYSFLIWRKK